MQRRMRNRRRKKKLLEEHQKWRQTFSGDAHSSLLQWTWWNTSSQRPYQQSQSRCICRHFKELHMTREKMREKRSSCGSSCCKEAACQHPYCPGCCSILLFSSLYHNYLKNLPQGTTLLIKSGYQDMKEEGDIGEEFKMYDLVDANGGFGMECPSSRSGGNKLTRGRCQSLIWATTTSGSTKPTMTPSKSC